MAARVWQVTTFAAEPFRGNPAFVVALEEDLPLSALCALAGQFGGVLAVLGPDAGDPVWLRFVTASGPHPGAGHAAAAAAEIVLDGRASAEVRFADGSLRRFSRDAASRVVVPWPAMPATASALGQVLGRALGQVPTDCLVAPFGYVAVYPDEATVRGLAPDMTALAALDRDAVIVTAPGAPGISDIAIRVFAPKVGLPEDPVCGTAHRIIVPFWAERLGRPDLHSRHHSPRGGDLWCHTDGASVTIAGMTCRVLEGRLLLS